MPRRFEEVAADFDALTASDFDDANRNANGWEHLDRLCGEMLAFNEVAACAPVMFRTIERLDTVVLGTPGPLVHTLETWRDGYESFLAESIRRKPSLLSVWMVNRILNAKPADGDEWLALLRGVAEHPTASVATKAVAARYLEFQAAV